MDIRLLKPIIPITDAAAGDFMRKLDEAAALLARRICDAYPDGGKLLAGAIRERGVENLRADIAESAERCRDWRRREAEVLRAYRGRHRRRP